MLFNVTCKSNGGGGGGGLFLLLFPVCVCVLFLFFSRHNSSLVGMVRIMCTVIQYLGFMGVFSLFNTHFYCVVGCLRMIFGHKLFWVSCMCFVFFIALVRRKLACFTWKGALEIG